MTTSRRLIHFPVTPYALLCSALTLLSIAPVRAQDHIKINSQRLSDRVLLTWACDSFQGTNMAIVAT